VFLLQNLVLVAMVFVIFWITFFPLISQALTGTKVSVGPPAFRPFIVPLALVLVALSGIGPLIAWRRVTVANLRRNFTIPLLVAAATFVVLVLASGTPSRPLALIMFSLGAFVLASVTQELWRGTAARRASTGDAAPIALARLIGRNHRRYGGYVVHAGLAVLLIGVAASSSFARSRDVILAPGQSARVDGYLIRYVHPTEHVSNAKVSFGAVLDVSKGGKRVTTLATSRGFYPAPDDPTLGPISTAFNGEADSDVGLRAGLTRDIWTVVNPDLTPLQPEIATGDRVFLKLMTSLSRKQASTPALVDWISLQRADAIEGIAARYVTHPWPVEFLLIVSPLVTWVWLGALIIASGGVIALSPIPVRARRTVASPSATPQPAPSATKPTPAREAV